MPTLALLTPAALPVPGVSPVPLVVRIHVRMLPLLCSDDESTEPNECDESTDAHAHHNIAPSVYHFGILSSRLLGVRMVRSAVVTRCPSLRLQLMCSSLTLLASYASEP
jgi:hypothetical protein